MPTYSWSRLNSFYQGLIGEGCLYSYYKTYIEGDRGESNYFAEYGLLLHETIEKLHNNELLMWDVNDEIIKGLANFQYKAPFENMRKSYENAIYKFFDEFDEAFKDYELLEAEEEKRFTIDDIHLMGFPDLVANHNKYGLVIGDYKSAKVYTGDKLNHNIQQLYLYSIPIHEKYGRYPDNLIYIYPREKENRERVYKFDLKKLEETKQWVRDIVAKLESYTGEWTPRCDLVDGEKDWFACHLCNHRRNCKYRYKNSTNQ